MNNLFSLIKIKLYGTMILEIDGDLLNKVGD